MTNDSQIDVEGVISPGVVNAKVGAMLFEISSFFAGNAFSVLMTDR